MACKGLSNLIETQAKLLCFHYQLLKFPLEQMAALCFRRRQALSDDRAASRVHLYQPFRNQFPDDLVRCVGG